MSLFSVLQLEKSTDRLLGTDFCLLEMGTIGSSIVAMLGLWHHRPAPFPAQPTPNWDVSELQLPQLYKRKVIALFS